MKCPKCQYLGFETGDRCRNCGYDFSLLVPSAAPPVDAELAPPAGAPLDASSWDSFAESGGPVDDAPLPLFALDAEDQPLVRLPPTPRPPVSVRRPTEASPHLRMTQTPLSLPSMEPDAQAASEAPAPLTVSQAVPTSPPPSAPQPGTSLRTSSIGRRALAATIDYALLVGIDLAIVYFTVRMAGLEMADWRLLPAVPLTLFLLVIGLAYVGVFTAMGGQTIGKMAAHIRVVSDQSRPLELGQAVQRTAAVLLSWLAGGLGFLPALVGDRRTLADRLARTRVVDLESA